VIGIKFFSTKTGTFNKIYVSFKGGWEKTKYLTFQAMKRT